MTSDKVGIVHNGGKKDLTKQNDNTWLRLEEGELQVR